MANDLSSNPLRIDTACTVVAQGDPPIHVIFMQWGGDDSAAGGALTAGDNLVMTINGVRVQHDTVIALSENVSWQFSQPFCMTSFAVTAIDGGTLYIWKSQI